MILVTSVYLRNVISHFLAQQCHQTEWEHWIKQNTADISHRRPLSKNNAGKQTMRGNVTQTFSITYALSGVGGFHLILDSAPIECIYKCYDFLTILLYFFMILLIIFMTFPLENQLTKPDIFSTVFADVMATY